MTIDEIIAKLETRRDHGPYLHELVYQLACTLVERNALSVGHTFWLKYSTTTSAESPPQEPAS